MKRLLALTLILLLASPVYAARLDSIGFETNSCTANIEVTTCNNDAATTATIGTTNIHSGTYAMETVLASDGESSASMNFASSYAAGALKIARIYVYIATTTDADTDIVQFSNTDGTAIAGIKLTTSSTLQGYTQNSTGNALQNLGSASAALTTGTWHYIDIAASTTVTTDATGANVFLEASIDGSSFVSSTATNVSAGPIEALRWGIEAGSWQPGNGQLWWDDIAINDASGSNQKTYPIGVGNIIRLSPNAAGDNNQFNSQTGGTAGSSNNFTRVNEVAPDGATSFNGATTTFEDLYNMTDSGLHSYDTVNVVEVHDWHRGSSSSANATYKLEIEKASGGTITQGSAVTPNSTTFRANTNATPFVPALVTYVDPTGAAWTNTTLDSMQAGMKVTTQNTNRDDISTLWVYVDYTAGSALATAYSLPYQIWGEW
ncbi:MAG: hypothetical protein KGL39_32885 [Patescibacteria group bacterium]|nr:hypothetical protein [Patescibacteria group bacterium]